MQATLAKYRNAIQNGSINPLKHWDGKTSGTWLDCHDEQTPLTMLSFGAYRLDDGPFTIETADREFVAVPIDAVFQARVGGKTFRGDRTGGPFAALPGPSNACAVYAPMDSRLELEGKGELITFSAPARGQKPPALVSAAQRENVPRGSATWLREVITLYTPEDVTTVLVGGETYSPPSLWSGTPLHVHDREDPAHGQSDHEEIYYHLARNTDGPWGPYGVQLLFDDVGLDKAYLIHNRDAFAIPGAAHPVVAGPCSDMLYLWALAGPGPSLAMLDVPEFTYLKKVGGLLDQWEQQRPRKPLSKAEFDKAIADAGLQPHEAHVLRMHLRERGIVVQ